MAINQLGKELSYKSDLFEFLHMSGYVKCPEYFDKRKFFDESVENTKKIFPDPFVQRKAEFAGGSFKGGMVVFPKQKSINMQNKLYNAVNSAINTLITELKTEYEDKSDPIDYHSIFNPPTIVFNAEFSNRGTGENFNEKSLVVQFGGIKAFTLDYIAEQLFDLVRAAVGGLTNMHISSILVYDLNKRMFYQYSDEKDGIYRKPFKSRHEKEILEYTIDNSQSVDEF